MASAAGLEPQDQARADLAGGGPAGGGVGQGGNDPSWRARGEGGSGRGSGGGAGGGEGGAHTHAQPPIPVPKFQPQSQPPPPPPGLPGVHAVPRARRAPVAGLQLCGLCKPGGGGWGSLSNLRQFGLWWGASQTHPKPKPKQPQQPRQPNTHTTNHTHNPTTQQLNNPPFPPKVLRQRAGARQGAADAHPLRLRGPGLPHGVVAAGHAAAARGGGGVRAQGGGGLGGVVFGGKGGCWLGREALRAGVRAQNGGQGGNWGLHSFFQSSEAAFAGPSPSPYPPSTKQRNRNAPLPPPSCAAPPTSRWPTSGRAPAARATATRRSTWRRCWGRPASSSAATTGGWVGVLNGGWGAGATAPASGWSCPRNPPPKPTLPSKALPRPTKPTPQLRHTHPNSACPPPTLSPVPPHPPPPKKLRHIHPRVGAVPRRRRRPPRPRLWRALAARRRRGRGGRRQRGARGAGARGARGRARAAGAHVLPQRAPLHLGRLVAVGGSGALGFGS